MEKSNKAKLIEAIRQTISILERMGKPTTTAAIEQLMDDRFSKLVQACSKDLISGQIRNIAADILRESAPPDSEQFQEEFPEDVIGEFKLPSWISLPDNIWHPFRTSTVAQYGEHVALLLKNAEASMGNAMREAKFYRLLKRHAPDVNMKIPAVFAAIQKKDQKAVSRQIQAIFGT